MTNTEVDVQRISGPQDAYPIFLGEGVLTDMGAYLKEAGFSGRCAVVTNPIIREHQADTVLNSLAEGGFQPTLCEIPDGEQHKNLSTVSTLYDQFLAAQLDRKSLVIALGGGVLGDTAGFAAATYMRGVPLVQIPTTLLSMVDSSVGGKTGVDLPQGKNLVGAFKQPEMVFIDPNTLSTLPSIEFKSGLAEVIKHGIIDALPLFEALEKGQFAISWMLAEAIMVKVRIVNEDPYEYGRRAVLNLGHTFGHAFEQVSRYEIRHGLAVSMGIVCAVQLAQNLNLCSDSEGTRIINLLKHLDMPIDKPDFDPETVYQAMGTDKKKMAGKLRFILPRAICDVDVFNDISKDAVIEVLAA
ncbi:MAG: 3-dehydroquinate synthase [Chloroflexota bacterium]